MSPIITAQSCRGNRGEPGCWWGDYVALLLCVQVWQCYESPVSHRQSVWLVSTGLCWVDWMVELGGVPTGLGGLTVSVEQIIPSYQCGLQKKEKEKKRHLEQLLLFLPRISRGSLSTAGCLFVFDLTHAVAKWWYYRSAHCMRCLHWNASRCQVCI